MPGGSFSSRPSWRAFARRLPARIAAQWRLKALLVVVLGVPFMLAYFVTGHFPLAPVRHMSLTWLDRAIGYHPYAWVWIYQSLYVPINVIPWLAERRED